MIALPIICSIKDVDQAWLWQHFQLALDRMRTYDLPIVSRVLCCWTTTCMGVSLIWMFYLVRITKSSSKTRILWSESLWGPLQLESRHTMGQNHKKKLHRRRQDENIVTSFASYAAYWLKRKKCWTKEKSWNVNNHSHYLLSEITLGVIHHQLIDAEQISRIYKSWFSFKPCEKLRQFF